MQHALGLGVNRNNFIGLRAREVVAQARRRERRDRFNLADHRQAELAIAHEQLPPALNSPVGVRGLTGCKPGQQRPTKVIVHAGKTMTARARRLRASTLGARFDGS